MKPWYDSTVDSLANRNATNTQPLENRKEILSYHTYFDCSAEKSGPQDLVVLLLGRFEPCTGTAQSLLI